jgi:hyperosmotically inducible protein
MKSLPLFSVLVLAPACARSLGADATQSGDATASTAAPGASDAIAPADTSGADDDARGAGASGLAPESAGTADANAASRTTPPELDEQPVDRVTSERVRQAILNDATLAPDAPLVRVGTTGGVVQLAGTVHDEPARRRMELVAGAVGGVLRVDNHLELASADARTPAPVPMEGLVDAVVSERVRQAFRNDATLADEVANVGVLSKDGVVQLSGSVRTEDVHERAVTLARAVGSVVRVDDRLTVRGR